MKSAIAMSAGMSAPHHVKSIIARIGDFVKRRQDTLWRIFVLLLIGWSSYNIGLIRSGRAPLEASSQGLVQTRASIVSQTPGPGRGSASTIDKSDLRVVVSKSSSSKKYHHSWCSSGLRIKEENRVWFSTAAAAQAAGYTLAGNCSE